MADPIKENVRLAAVAVMRLALRLRSQPFALPRGGALIVAPHADDETLGCGGFIAAQAAAGHPLEIAFLTDSAASHPGHLALPPPVLARIRREEAQAALAVLGAASAPTHFLGLPDGALNRLPAPDRRGAVEQLTGLIRRARPEAVFAPYRHGGSTEHTAAWGLAAEALEAAGGGSLLEYPIWAWWNPLRLRYRLAQRGNFRLALGARRQLKTRALACHASQVRPVPPWPEPVLPGSLARACCGPEEFFFASFLAAGQNPATFPS